MRNVWCVLAVLVVVTVAAGCGGRGGEQPAAQQPTPGASPATAASPQPAASPAAGASPAAPGRGVEGGEVVIVMKDNLYEPATVTIKAGQEYEFVAKNEGTTVHNLIIQAKDQVGQDFASDIAVNAGQDSKFKVKIDKEGTYPMVCTYHPEMKGEVKVVR